MRHGDIGDMPIHGPVLQLRGVKMRDLKKRPGGAAGVPGEDVTIGMATGNGCVIGGDGNGRDGARLDSC